MGFFSSLRSIKKWFTDKAGITRESVKRKHDECEIINNKRARMDDSLVEVVEISDESLSEVEEVEITEPGPPTVPLRASPPVMLVDGRHHQSRTMSPIKTVDLTESSDDEKKIRIFRSYSLSSEPLMKSTSDKSSIEDSLISSVKESRKSNFNVEDSLSALHIASPTNNSKDKILGMILKNYVAPRSENSGLSTSNSRSPLSVRKENILNQSKLSQTSDKENSDIPELSVFKNRIIRHEMFYERILRKFRETQAASISDSTAVEQQSPEDVFSQKLERMRKELEKIDPSKKKEVFPNYSQEVVGFISDEMNGPPHEYIRQGKNITRNDLNTVYQPTAWLNDEVINHYLSLIIDRDPNSLHTFDTFFYTKLVSQGYQSVRRWSRKKDIFACKKMFTPIHLGNHWCLICVDFTKKTIQYYDSLGGPNHKCLNAFMYYLKEEHKNKKNAEFNCSGWQLMLAKDCPRQRNGYDCGVFTCINAEYLARDAKLDFTQDDMPKLRQRICYEILKNRLCY